MDFNYDQTMYPKIFNKTFWGYFDCKFLDEDKFIFENRNKFIQEYNIKRCCGNKIPQYIEYDVDLYITKIKFLGINDHRECYLDEDKNYVFIVSPYSRNIKEGEEDEFLKNTPFKKIYQLYNPKSITYMMIIKNHKNQKRLKLTAKRYYQQMFTKENILYLK